MPHLHLPRRLTVVATAALCTGAGAAPALAAAPTPLVQSIEKVQKATQLNIDENFQNAAGDHQVIQALVANAYALEQGTDQVAHIPAVSSQQAGKAMWLSGERAFIREDVQMANVAYMFLAGQRATAQRELQVQLTANNRNDGLVARADRTLGVH